MHPELRLTPLQEKVIGIILVLCILTLMATMYVGVVSAVLSHRAEQTALQHLRESDRKVHENFQKLCDITQKFEEDQHMNLPELDKRCTEY